VTAILLCALLCFSAVAAAEEATEEPAEAEVGRTAANPYLSPFGLVVPSSNGYVLTINSAKGGRVTIEASGAKGAVTYSAPGSVSDTGIHANFGKYGRIDMRWVPNGQVREVRQKCHYDGVRTRFYDDGAYEGTLRFKGGDGFTSATVDRVAWKRSWFVGPLACGYSVSTGEPGAGVVIEAGHRGHLRGALHLFVYRPQLGAKVEYQAHSDQTKGRVKISREAYAEGGTHSFRLAATHGTTTATIDPPAPFSGGATFERAQGSKGTLSGPLGVEFPDHTKVDLAGRNFEAFLRLESINIYPG